MRKIHLILLGVSLILIMSSLSSAFEITGVTVEDFSSHLQWSGATARHPDNTLNNTGLDPNTGFHTIWPDDSTWTSDWLAPIDDQYVVYDLGAQYGVNLIRIWNSNSWDATTAGIDEFEILLSTDNITFVSMGLFNLALAPQSAEVDFSELIQLTPGGDFRYVKLDINTNHGFPQVIILAEIKFFVDGNAPPTVDAGGNQSVWLTNGTVDVNLNGSASDDGQPDPPGVLTTEWTASGPGDVVIAEPTNPVTTATFTIPGEYFLQLQASDSALSNSSIATIIVYNNECEAAKADLNFVGMDEDINSDCSIDYGDFGVLAGQWQDCYGDPNNPNCISPWNPTLLHRWSFNGDYTDSVGGATAVPQGMAEITTNMLDLTSNAGLPSYPDPNAGNPTNPVAAWAELPIQSSLESLSQAITVELWINWPAFDDVASRVFDFGNGWDNGINFRCESGFGSWATFSTSFPVDYTLADSPSTINTGELVHVVVTYDKHSEGLATGNVKLFINGQPDSVGHQILANVAPSDIDFVSAFLGRYSDSTSAGFRMWSGFIDEVRIYDGILRDEQILENFNCGPDNMSCVAPFTLTLCQDIIDAGYGIGIPDFDDTCVVDLGDLSIVIGVWLDCNIPWDLSCQ